MGIGDRLSQRVIAGSGGKTWWHAVVAGGGARRCYLVVVRGGGSSWWLHVEVGGGDPEKEIDCCIPPVRGEDAVQDCLPLVAGLCKR